MQTAMTDATTDERTERFMILYPFFYFDPYFVLVLVIPRRGMFCRLTVCG
jgi:hypothetical protein